MQAAELATILYVERNDDDVLLFNLALRRAHLSVRLRVVPDGRQGIEYLTGNGNRAKRSNNPFPDLAFVDWHMSSGRGADFLLWCRERADYSTLPVVALCSVGSARELEEAKNMGAKFALRKPCSAQHFSDCLSQIYRSVMMH